MLVKDLPSGDDPHYGYDNLGRLVAARFGPSGLPELTFAYDALSRLTSETSYGRTLSHQYDLSGARTRLTFPDSNYVDYVRDYAGQLDQARLNGATSGRGLFVDNVYDNLGRVSSVARGNGTSTAFTYDTDSLDWSFDINVAGTSQDTTISYGLNPAGQIVSQGITDPDYPWTPSTTTTSTSYTRNGLNQYSNVGGVSFSHDTRGNLTSDGSRTPRIL